MPVESYWPLLFAKLAEKINIGDLIINVGSGGGGGGAVAVAAPTAAGGGAAAPPPVEEKKVIHCGACNLKFEGHWVLFVSCICH